MLMSVGAVLALVLTLAAIDDRVREQVVLRMGTPARASAEIVTTGGEVRDLAGVLYQAVRDQSIEHAPMVTFVLAGGIFLIIMLRT
jgi:hypothetical protein